MNTPLDDAKKGKFTEIVLFLKKNGAKSKVDKLGKFAIKKLIKKTKDDREIKYNSQIIEEEKHNDEI